MAISIRLADERETLAQIAELLSRAFLTSPVYAGIEEGRYSRLRIEARLARGEQLLALDGELLIGAVTIFPPDPSSHCSEFRSAPQLGLLGVDPRRGGAGIGTALIGAVEAQALAQGHGLIVLSVTQRAPLLHSLYSRLGYSVAREFHWPGASDPSFIMHKQLG